MTVDEIFAAIQALAESKANVAQDLSTQAANLTVGGNLAPGVPTIPAVSVVEPNIYIPTHAAGVDMGLFDSSYQQIITDLSDKYAAFLVDFFPVDDALMAGVQGWLQQVLGSGGTGVNAAVEAQIWQRARDRIGTEAASASEESMAVWSSRGFPLPPGAAVASLQAIARDRAAQMAGVSRDAAIEAFNREVENARFAVQNAISFRSQSVQAAGDYIRAMALGPQLATQLATTAADAQARLISSVGGYLNARVNVAELAQRRNLAVADQRFQANVREIETFKGMVGIRTDATVGAANSLGQQAAAALNALNAVVQKNEG